MCPQENVEWNILGFNILIGYYTFEQQNSNFKSVKNRILIYFFFISKIVII